MFLLEYIINYFVFNVFYFFRRQGNRKVESLNNAFSFLMLYCALFVLLFLNILNKISNINALWILFIYLLMVLICGIIFKILLINKKFLTGYRKKIQDFAFLEKKKNTNMFVLALGGIAILLLALIIK
jgi:hypothetical protein